MRKGKQRHDLTHPIEFKYKNLLHVLYANWSLVVPPNSVFLNLSTVHFKNQKEQQCCRAIAIVPLYKNKM
jgi:hypothetical protein